MTHFHVYLGGTHGFMHGEAAFDTAAPSIEAFLGIVGSLLGDKLEVDRATTEMALLHTAETETDEAIYVDAGKMRVVWVVCETACQDYLRN